MEIIDPIKLGGKIVPSNCNTTQANFNLDSFNPKDIMELHRKIEEGVYWDVIKYTMSTNKLQDLVNKLESQLKNERSSTKAR